MAASYVRFLRGTPLAFTKVEKKDPDTLYFISEKDATSGDLYLGNKLIAGRELSNMTLGVLKDVILDATKGDGSILVYDDAAGNWKQKSVEEVVSSLYYIMHGASSTADGTSGLVPVPKAGQQNFFLRGDATWADPVASVNNVLATLIGEDGNQSIRQIAVSALEKALIPDNAKESLDTLKEIAEWIQKHPDDASAINNRLNTLETTIYDTKGDEGVTITKGLETKVGDLAAELADLKVTVSSYSGDINNVTRMVNNVYQRLQWQEMDESTTKQ